MDKLHIGNLRLLELLQLALDRLLGRVVDGKLVLELGLATEWLVILTQPIAINLDDGVAVVAVTHIERTVHQRINLATAIVLECVVMAAQMHRHAILREKIDVLVIVIQILISDGIVIYGNHSLILMLRESLIEPSQILLLDVAIGSLHIWTAVDTNNHHSVEFGYKPIAAPHIHKTLAGALRPLVLVVTRHHILRLLEPIQNALHALQLLVATLVREVTRHDYNLCRTGVNLLDHLFEFLRVAIARRNVQIGQKGYACLR